ncbi:hypothetical protein F5Y12DRAFT_775429 [Xylaria sp. FL1777]|nr:hypothetical protein F5Y12DRAFT_775429 [Xylaria sp. FL1777]
MEVVGTVAATVQLVGMAMSILDSIAQLHDLIKCVPGRFQRWHTELDLLGETIKSIQHNAALQTFQVGRVMENMCPKIESLLILCKKHTPPSKASPIIKIIKNLSAHSVEPRIIEHLQSLEHDKTTLLLAIQLLPATNSTQDLCSTTKAMSNYNPNTSHKTHTKVFPWKAAEDSQQTTAGIFPFRVADSDQALVKPVSANTPNKKNQGKPIVFPQGYCFARQDVFYPGGNPSGHNPPQPYPTYVL